MVVVLADDGDDGRLRLDGKVERAFLEGQQVRLGDIGPGAFREYPELELKMLET